MRALRSIAASRLRGRRAAGVLCASALWLAGSVADAAQVCALGRMAIVESRRDACHALLAIVLDARGTPTAAGSVCLTKSAALHQLTRRGDYVVAQLWNAIEIYSFADPRAPRLVRSFTLAETHPSWGGGGIVHEGDRLLVLGTTVSAELTMAGPPAAWSVRNLEPTAELRRRTEGLYDQAAREKDATAVLPRLVPLAGGVFAVLWRETRPSAGVLRHRQYLRAVESGATMLIDTHDETID
jgi:hypothetical protein